MFCEPQSTVLRHTLLPEACKQKRAASGETDEVIQLEAALAGVATYAMQYFTYRLNVFIFTVIRVGNLHCFAIKLKFIEVIRFQLQKLSCFDSNCSVSYRYFAFVCNTYSCVGLALPDFFSGVANQFIAAALLALGNALHNSQRKVRENIINK